MKKSLQLIVGAFFIGFLFNLIWEELHSYLYVMPPDFYSRQLLLFRSTLFDAFWISVLILLYIKVEFLRKRIYLPIIAGVLGSVISEIIALKTGRWQYNELMPIIPLIKTGITPTIQIGLIFYIIIRFFKVKHI